MPSSFFLPVVRIVGAGMLVLLGASSAFAQRVLAGTVADAAGRAVAGASIRVEGQSLMQPRTATAGQDGRYRVLGVQPGVFTVTFGGAGFRTLVHENVFIGSHGDSRLDVVLEAGSPQEVVSFVGRRHVDVGATSSARFEADVIGALPITRNAESTSTLLPGITTALDDSLLDHSASAWSAYGRGTMEGRLLLDGMPVSSPVHGGQPGHFLLDLLTADSVVMTTGGMMDAETAGPRLHVTPRYGSSVFSGTVFAVGNTEAMQGDNVGEELKAMGIVNTSAITSASDLSGWFAGPLVRDRVWFLALGRQQRVRRSVRDLFPNAFAGDPSRFVYRPDTAVAVYSDRSWENLGARFDVRVGSDGHTRVIYDEQAVCRTCSGVATDDGFIDRRVSPEAQGVGDVRGQRLLQGTWSAPLGSRLLLESGASRYAFGWGSSEREGNDRTLARAVDQGFAYRSQDWADHHASSTTWRAVVTVTAGAHLLRFGYEGVRLADDREYFTNDRGLVLGLANGVPRRLTQVVGPFPVHGRAAQTSVFARDQWTRGRITLHGGVRMDVASSWYPEHRIEPGPFRAEALVLPRTDGVDSYRDVTPRGGLAIDATGSGRTIVRVHGVKYLDGLSMSGVFSGANPVLDVVRTIDRTWFDYDGDYVPDCDLSNPAAQSTPGGDFCAAVTNPFFGRATGLRYVDAALLSGSGIRPSEWNVGTSVEQRLREGLYISAGFSRRQFDGAVVADNIRLGPQDYVTVTASVPTVPGLPRGGGQSVGPLYVLRSSGTVPFEIVTTRASAFGDVEDYVDAFDATIDGRTPFGLVVKGGTSTARRMSDTCEVRAALPEIAPLDPYCRTSSGFLTHVRALATYTVPRAEVQLGAVYRNISGPALAAFSTSFVSVPGGGFTSATFNVVEPGTLYGDRVTELDLRATKSIRWGRTRVAAGVDLYNAFNAAAPVTYSSTLTSGPLAIVPTSVQAPRLLRLVAEVSF